MSDAESQLSVDLADDLASAASTLRGRIDEAMASFDPGFVAATMCIWADSPDSMGVSLVSVGSPSARAAALAERSIYDRRWRAWDPHCFEITDLELRGPADSAAVREMKRRIMGAVGPAGIEEPGVWVLNRVLRILNRDPPACADPDHFIAYVLDDQFGEELVRNIETAGTPPVIASLRSDGLLPSHGTGAGPAAPLRAA